MLSEIQLDQIRNFIESKKQHYECSFCKSRTFNSIAPNKIIRSEGAVNVPGEAPYIAWITCNECGHLTFFDVNFILKNAGN